jgi:hypothetical protein
MFINTLPAEEVADLLRQASLRVVGMETQSQIEGDREIEYVWFVAEK